MSWYQALLGLLLTLATFVVSNIVVVVLLLKLPEDYFLDKVEAAPAARRHIAVHWPIVIGKNLLGLALVLVGIVLALPGVPGPGLLCIVLGLMLISVPGKRRLARTLIRRPTLLRAVNQLRGRFGRPPLVLEPKPESDLPKAAPWMSGDDA